MRTAHIAVLGLIAAMAALWPVYLAAGDQPQSVSGPQSPNAARDVTQSPSGAGNGLFVPACTLDSTLWNMKFKGEQRPDQRPKTDPSPAAATHFKVGSFECQS
jgi:hypothetical protein